MNKKELRRELRARGLDVNGNKEELQARLRSTLEATQDYFLVQGAGSSEVNGK